MIWTPDRLIAELLNAMQEKGDAPYDKGCTRMETKSINGQNIREGRLQALKLAGTSREEGNACVCDIAGYSGDSAG